MKQFFLSIALCGTAVFFNPVSLSAQTDDTARADASIKTATVYFGYGAELSHESKVRVSAGTRTIIIGNLSTSADINSLQISVPEHVALLSQRYLVYQPVAPVAGKTRETERMEDSIENIQKEISRIENLVAIDKEVLAKTGLLVETTVSTSGNKTVASAEVLKLLEYYNAKIEKSRTSIFNNQQEINRQNKRVADIRKRIAEAAVMATPAIQKPYGQVILQVMCKQAGEIPVNLSYYSARAGWTAMYDVRANSKTNKVKLVYKASLTQNTGIDWVKAKLVLSTGTPNFGVTAPILTPWQLQLYVPGLYNDLQRRAAVGNAQRNVVQSFNNDMNLAEVVVTGANGQYKTKQLEEKTVDPSSVEQYTTLNEGQLNTSYEIDLPYDIASDGQLNSVTIKEEEITCTMKNYAVPRADKEAYLLAEIPDWQNLDLLPGDANIIMDDTYIGRSLIDPNTTADTLNLSLGKDKRLVVKRSLVKEQSSLKTSGTNTKQVFTYELLVKNNKLTDVNLVLKDQFPISNINEVTVTLDDDGAASVNKETGILTWKLELKPGESKKVRFSYTVKYPKDKKIVNLK